MLHIFERMDKGFTGCFGEWIRGIRAGQHRQLGRDGTAPACVVQGETKDLARDVHPQPK